MEEVAQVETPFLAVNRTGYGLAGGSPRTELIPPLPPHPRRPVTHTFFCRHILHCTAQYQIENIYSFPEEIKSGVPRPYFVTRIFRTSAKPEHVSLLLRIKRRF